MFRTSSIFVRFLAAVLLIGVLVAAGVWIYRAGFDQGMIQAALLSRENAPQAVPSLPYYPWGYGGPYFGFFPGFRLFGIILFGLFFLFIFRWLFRPWAWGSHGHWHGHPHPWGEPPAKDRPAEKAGTGAGSSPAGPEMGQG